MIEKTLKEIHDAYDSAYDLWSKMPEKEKEWVRQAVASYALAACIDSSVRKEVEMICTEEESNCAKDVVDG